MLVAETMTKLLGFMWKKGRGQIALKNAKRNSAIYGTGIIKVVYDSDQDIVRYVSVPPDQFYPDPNATSDDDLWYAFHVYDISLNDVEKNWPDKIGAIRSGKRRDQDSFNRDAWRAEDDDGSIIGSSGQMTFTQGTSTHTQAIELTGGEDGAKGGAATLMEFWERSPKSGRIRLHYIIGNTLLASIDDPLGDKIRRFPFGTCSIRTSRRFCKRSEKPTTTITTWNKRRTMQKSYQIGSWINLP